MRNIIRVVKIKFLLLFLASSVANSQNNDLDFLEIKEKAISHYQKEEFNRAENTIEEYLKLNPYDNELIYLSAQTAYHLKNWNKAIEFFKSSINNGYKIPDSKYNIACCYALQGNKKEASNWLKEAINDHPLFYYQWMEDPDLTILSEDPIYLNKLHHYKRDLIDRDSQWIADIDFYNDRMKQFHYDLFKHLSEESWNKKINKLKSEVKSLKDDQIIARLMELTAWVGDGHTILVPPVSGKYQFGLYPFLSYIFDDGIYILETHKKYEQLLGAKLIAINGIAVSEVIERIKIVIPSDNEFGSKWLEPLALSLPEVLYGLNITPDKDSFKLTYTKDQDTNTIEVKATERLTADFLKSWLFGYHQIEDWVKIKQSKIPSSQLKTDEPYWFEYIPEEQLLVFHYNQVQTNPDESEQEFMDKLNEFIDENPVKALAVDLRFNEGGDNTVYPPLLNGIISNKKINKEGKLFVIVGRRTFSAAMCFATELEKSTDAIFVGEPTGSSPNFVGETGGVFQLPYSGLYVNASNLFWQNSYAFDNRKYISPDIYVPVKFDDFQNGVDASLESVVHILNK